jgi:hypothetical protein
LLDGPAGGGLRPTAGDAKTNAPKAALALLEGLVLDGRLVTADALFGPRHVAERILEQGGHYGFAVKDNHETLRKDLQAAFEPAFSPLRDGAAAWGGRHRQQYRPARGAGRSAEAWDDDATK